MNIYQAAKAVVEGRAEDARRPLIKGGLLWMLKEDLIDLADLIATDWELVGEKPRMERVEARQWGVLDPPFRPGEQPRLGATLYAIRDDAFERLVKQYPGRQAVEIVYHYDRPIPEEVTEFAENEYTGPGHNLASTRAICFVISEALRQRAEEGK